ncbi:MAG: hypothetical protein VX874_19950 [Pseudomonadota bacterium]|nr:hypothetical protein [Pseudomonadota bacterium]
MTILRTTLLVTGAAFALSGCGALSLISKAQEFDALSAEVNALSTTPTANMPTNSSARYTGNAQIAADYGTNSNVGFIGDSDLTANFTSTGGTIVGTLNNFSGLELNASQRAQFENGELPDNILTSAKRADGSIAIDGSFFGPAIAASANGELEMGGSTYAVSGLVEGEFRGNNAEAVRMTESTGFTMRQDGVAPTSGTTTEILGKQ